MAASAVDAYRREVEVLKQLQEGASCVCVWCRAHVCCTTSCVCCVLGRAGQDGGPHSSPTAEATAHLPTLCIRPPFLHRTAPPQQPLFPPHTNTDLQRNASSQQTFLSQRHENDMVLAELERVADGDAVFKLTGGALLKQDPSEAVATVRKRLDYIGGELERLEAAAKDLNARAEKAQARVAAAQAEAVKAQAAAGGVAQKAG